MVEKQTFVLISQRVRDNARDAIARALPNFIITVSPPKRSNDQNAKFHAICADFARSPLEWFGKRRSLEDWKVLLISGHATVTRAGGEVVPGLEGEFVAIRESSAKMTVGRASSLIEYSIAYAVSNGVELTETEKHGFLNERIGSDRQAERRAS